MLIDDGKSDVSTRVGRARPAPALTLNHHPLIANDLLGVSRAAEVKSATRAESLHI
jgi:hypothetical protein